MPTPAKSSQASPPPSKPAADIERPQILSASVPETLASLQVNPDTGLTHAAVDVRRKEHGYNEVAVEKSHPFRKFLGKFWGISAWMLELILVLSAVLGKYSDLVVVSALLVINAVLSFAQERRAAGVVEALRKRLQVNARVQRDSSWQVVPARDHFAAFSVVSARERRWFCATMPSKTLIAALVADALIGTLLTRVGLSSLKPLPWSQTLAIFGYALVSCLVVNDAVKVAMIKWRAPEAAA